MAEILTSTYKSQRLTSQKIPKLEYDRREAMEAVWLLPDTTRCVQCGICSHNCPMGIDVRKYSWLGRPVSDSRCLTCGQCMERCPRNVLVFEQLPIYSKRATK